MEKSEQKQLSAILAHLGVAFGIDLSEARLRIYLEHLREVPLPQLATAITAAEHTCKFFPSIAELRELAGACHSSLEDQAIAAWDDLRCFRRNWNPSALEDPLVRRCFDRLGGRTTFGMWDYEKEEHWKRKEFIDLYQALARTGKYLPLTHQESAGVLSHLNSRTALSHPTAG